MVPKNAFDAYVTAKQKKLFTSLIARITWLNKLSPETVNLEGRDVQEIQIFRVELKEKDDPQAILNVIDKAIPYHLIFIVVFDDQIYFSASAKHNHPLNGDNSVIDWTFKTDWKTTDLTSPSIILRKNLDAIFHDFCAQLSVEKGVTSNSLGELVFFHSQLSKLRKEIDRLKQDVKSSKSFKKKVELNLDLKSKELELSRLLNL